MTNIWSTPSVSGLTALQTLSDLSTTFSLHEDKNKKQAWEVSHSLQTSSKDWDSNPDFSLISAKPLFSHDFAGTHYRISKEPINDADSQASRPEIMIHLVISRAQESAFVPRARRFRSRWFSNPIWKRCTWLYWSRVTYDFTLMTSDKRRKFEGGPGIEEGGDSRICAVWTLLKEEAIDDRAEMVRATVERYRDRCAWIE